MKNKFKNPLYVVSKKNKTVEEADGVLDLLVKKLGLEPVLEFLEMMIKVLLEQINSYPTFLAIKSTLDFLVSKMELFKRFSII